MARGAGSRFGNSGADYDRVRGASCDTAERPRPPAKNARRTGRPRFVHKESVGQPRTLDTDLRKR
jgi:hypothetical protein